MKILQFIRRHLLIIIVYSVFVAVSLALLHWYQYSLNPDAPSYFSIAREYAAGDIKAAINGYWGPLFSILLVPAVWLHIDLIIASKILITCLCVLIIIVLYRLLIKKNVSRFIAGVGSFVLASLLITWSTYDAITPDILLALLVLLWAFVLFDFVAKATLKNIILLAIIGALMYFTKGFGLFLFVGCMSLLGLYKASIGRKNLYKSLRPYLLVAAFFLIFVSPFIVAISLKNGTFTINTAGEFNHRVMGPDQKSGYPSAYLGPLMPHNQLAINAWETPNDFTATMPKWSIFSSRDNFVYYVNSVVLKNTLTTVSAFYGFGPFVVVGFLCIIVGAFARSKILRREYRVLALISIPMIVGYCLVYSEARYILAVAIFSIIGTCLVLSQLFKAKKITYFQIVLVAIVVTLPLISPTLQSIITNRNEGIEEHGVATYVETFMPKQSDIISNDFDSYRVCYFANLRCYGVLNLQGQDPATYAASLKKLGITYYIDYSNIPKDNQQTAFIDTYFTEYSYYSGARAATIYTLK